MMIKTMVVTIATATVLLMLRGELAFGGEMIIPMFVAAYMARKESANGEKKD